MHLLKNQTTCIDKLTKYKVGAIFMEPGTGKTLTAYKLAESVPGKDYVLWFTPFQTKNNLKHEINKCGDMPISIIGTESLSNSDRLYLELIARLNASKQPVIIVDESLKIKNYDAKRTKRILALSTMAQYKLILNGTPLSKNLLDLWPQMEFLSPKILRMGLLEFKNTFCEYVKITKRIGHKKSEKEFIIGYHNVDHLYKLIGPFVFESKLSLDINCQYINIDYSLTPEEKQEHDEIKNKYLDDEAMEVRNNNIFLEITSKLQHNYSCSPEKFQIAREIIKKYGSDKVLIYARFISTQEALREAFPGVQIMSWQKHSFGLNLQHYNRIISFDKVWDYALRVQRNHRVYRLGQKETCYFYELTGDVGLEDMMDKNINKKGRLLDYFKRKSVEELRRIL